MKPTLKVALLATVLMATTALAGDMAKDSNSNTMAVDANGKMMHHKHMHHHHDMDGTKDMDGMHHRGYRDANGNWHDANGNVSRNVGPHEYVYNDYYNRNAQRTWMGIDLNTRHMTDGSDTDANNRGRHAYIFDQGLNNQQDFRVGSGHVVKF